MNDSFKVELINEDSQIPVRRRVGDAAFDVFAPEDIFLYPHETKVVGLGIKMQLPKGHCALVIERSGHAMKHSILSIGPLIDPNYRGEIHAILLNHGCEYVKFKKGDRIAQILVFKFFQEDPIIEAVDETERGESGLGSSGN